MTADRSGSASIAAAAQQVAIIPREPGPVRLLADALHVDEFIDPIDEPADPDDRPGRADLVLLAVGVVLVGAGLLTPNGTLVTVGVVAIILGVALPLQAGVRAVRGRRMAARTRRVLTGGYAMDLSTRDSRALIAAYDRVLAVTSDAVAGRRGEIPMTTAVDARSAAHRALVEAASLLDGRAPSAAAERAYVRRRTEAMTALAGTLTYTALESRDAEESEQSAGHHDLDDRAAAIAMAREELDAETGLGSLDQIAEVTERLRQGRGDVAAR